MFPKVTNRQVAKEIMRTWPFQFKVVWPKSQFLNYDKLAWLHQKVAKCNKRYLYLSRTHSRVCYILVWFDRVCTLSVPFLVPAYWSIPKFSASWSVVLLLVKNVRRVGQYKNMEWCSICQKLLSLMTGREVIELSFCVIIIFFSRVFFWHCFWHFQL